jgi:hypothetical protein
MDSLFLTNGEKGFTEDLMTIAKTELFSDDRIHRPPTPAKRNLGIAILAGAIEDYRCSDPEAHAHAKEFLYPRTTDWRDHYNWVVSLAEGVNPAWFRDVLDRSQSKWDEQRYVRMARRAKRNRR